MGLWCTTVCTWSERKRARVEDRVIVAGAWKCMNDARALPALAQRAVKRILWHMSLQRYSLLSSESFIRTVDSGTEVQMHIGPLEFVIAPSCGHTY